MQFLRKVYNFLKELEMMMTRKINRILLRHGSKGIKLRCKHLQFFLTSWDQGFKMAYFSDYDRLQTTWFWNFPDYDRLQTTWCSYIVSTSCRLHFSASNFCKNISKNQNPGLKYPSKDSESFSFSTIDWKMFEVSFS